MRRPKLTPVVIGEDLAGCLVSNRASQYSYKALILYPFQQATDFNSERSEGVFPVHGDGSNFVAFLPGSIAGIDVALVVIVSNKSWVNASE